MLFFRTSYRFAQRGRLRVFLRERADAIRARFYLVVRDQSFLIPFGKLPFEVGRIGHGKVDSRPKRLGAVSDRSPVGNDHAVETQRVAQNIVKKMTVFRGVNAVDGIIAAHHRPGFCLQRDFKRAAIGFPQSAFVHLAALKKAVVLTIIRSKVFERSSYALTLHPFDIGFCKRAGEHAVLGKIFKVPPAKRSAFEVNAGAEQNRDVVQDTVLRKRLSHAIHEAGIKTVSERGQSGITGRIFRNLNPVFFAHDVAQSVRSVGYAKGGNPAPLCG